MQLWSVAALQSYLRVMQKVGSTHRVGSAMNAYGSADDANPFMVLVLVFGLIL